MIVLPRIPARILRALLPLAERDEIVGDIEAEYGTRAVQNEARAQVWLWRQVIGSAPALVRRSWWRAWTGFEPRANAMRTGGPTMERWLLDLRFSLRRLGRRPTYAVLAVLTLALGVGGTAAIAGIVRALFIDPLPYRDEAALAMLWNPGNWNAQEFLHLRPSWESAGFAAVAAYRDEDVTVDQAGAPTRLVRGIAASSELFDVLGVSPVVGRAFQPGDDAPGAEPVAVLSHGLWRELGSDPSIVGSRLRLDGVERTIIGVAPSGFWFPDPSVRVWIPVVLNPESRTGILAFVGRVAMGNDVAHMSSQLARITTLLEERFDYMPQWDNTKNASLTSFRDHFIGPMRPAMLATLGAMGLILLIACANVSALMLGQVEGRATELGVRTALGAERGRLLAQIVSEAVVIGLLAGAVGAVLAVGGQRVLVETLPLGAWGDRATLDWTLFAAAIGIALLSAIAVALLPAFALRRADLRGVLARARTGGLAGGGRVGLQSGLVVGEVALAVLLAAGAALLVRSVGRLYDIDPGVETQGIAVLDVALPADVQTTERLVLIRNLVDAMGELPGVRSAAASPHIPLRHGGDNGGITIPGRPDLESATTYFRLVSPAYFETMGIQRRAGRTFTVADRPTAADTTEVDVVINEALAREYFEGVDPVGRYTGGGFGVPERIIGVVADAAEGTLTEERKPTRYYLQDQIGWVMDGQTFVMRTERGTDAARVLEAARAAVTRAAPGVAVQEATTMDRIFANAVGPARQVMTLLSLLTGLALVLGAVGVYGVVAHLVSRRLRDWSIRMALGLDPSRVIGQVVRYGTGLAAIGVVLGVAGAVALSRLLESLLYGIGASDPLSLGSAGVALLIVAALAALIPAIRASRADPALVLREQ